MEESNDTKQTKVKKRKQLKPTARQMYLVTAALSLLLLTTTGILIYKKVESNDKKAISKSPFGLNTSLADRLKNGKNALPIQAVSGNVVTVNETEIVIEQQNKQQKTFKINESTRITLKKDDKKIADVLPGVRVTVFARTESDKSSLATRVLIREESPKADRN